MSWQVYYAYEGGAVYISTGREPSEQIVITSNPGRAAYDCSGFDERVRAVVSNQSR